MSLFDRLADPAEWAAYLAYKTEKRHLTRAEEADLKAYVDAEEYLAVAEKLRAGGSFSVPEKKLIRKMGSEKKRVVYLFPREENYFLKLLTFLLLRQYDGAFPENLYSFRAGAGVARAMRRVLRTPGLRRKYSYKADIHDYFNSIPVEKLLPALKELLTGEEEVCRLLESILRDPRVRLGDEILEEKKGTMAGTPFAVFLANLYLADMDREAECRGYSYARYSDDILILADSEAEREEAAGFVQAFLKEKGLELNEKKVARSAPGEPWSFLGLEYADGTVDISPVSREKLKAKMRRKARALKRWQVKKGASGEQAAKGFIRAMNRKFFNPSSSHELTWSRWYFPLITTDRTLRELDRYMQDWIRFLLSGRHSKGNYSFRYEELKALGYVTLVNAWYAERKEERSVPAGNGAETGN